MNDIKIDLSEVNPQDFFGDQNRNIAKLRTYFPKIKIVARGNTLKAYGEEAILTEFSKRVEMLLAHFGKFNILNDEIIERIVLAGTENSAELNGGTETQILHGVGGKIIKAKTYNQKRLVESMHKNDMVFAASTNVEISTLPALLQNPCCVLGFFVSLSLIYFHAVLNIGSLYKFIYRTLTGCHFRIIVVCLFSR